MKRYPYFPLWARDFLMSPTVRSMSATQLGAYILLLCLDWDNDGLPDDDAACMAYLPRDAVDHDFARVVREFREKHPETGRRTHRRANAERIRNLDFSAKQAENGRKGGRPPKAIASHGKTQNNPALSVGNPTGKPDEAPNTNPDPDGISIQPRSGVGKNRPLTESDAIQQCKADLVPAPDEFTAQCFHQLEAVSWIDATGLREVTHFTAYVRKAYARHCADGRPAKNGPVAKKRPRTQDDHGKPF